MNLGDSLTRHLMTLGLERVAKVPTLADYFKDEPETDPVMDNPGNDKKDGEFQDSESKDS